MESKFYFGFRDQKLIKGKHIENVETVANGNRDQNNGLNLKLNQNYSIKHQKWHT